MTLGRLAVPAFAVLACGPIEGVALPEETGEETVIDPSGSSSTGAAVCDITTLDTITLGQVYIEAGTFSDIARGTSRQLRLAKIVGGYPQDVEACVTWSVTPDTLAMISDVGVVVTSAQAPVGSQIVVTADIEDGRRILELEMMLYEPMVTPILGIWSETERISCTSGTFAPTSPVGELAFYDNGEFKVTWTPFEAYVDYWGAYTHAPDSGSIALTIFNGNFTPLDFDGYGAAFVNGSTLELTGMFLGTALGDEPMVACGHRFE